MFPEIFDAVNEVRPAPEPTKFVADRVLLVVFQVKLPDCNSAPVPLPTNSWPLVKVVAPVPPWETVIFPEIFDAVNEVRPAPEPTKFVADRVLLVVFQVKLPDCNSAPVPLPTNSWPLVKVVAPVPPWETVIFPEIFDAAKDVKLAPEPLNNVAVTVPLTSSIVPGLSLPIPTFPLVPLITIL